MLGLSHTLPAQTVRGVVVSESGSEPLGGFIVVLLDGTGRQRAGALTDEEGQFTLRAPEPGHYSLRAERVGRRSATSPVFRLEAGQTLDYRLPIHHQAVQLPAVRVRADRKCTLSPDAGQTTFALWGEVRKALNATMVVQEQRYFRVTLLLYERDLHPRSLKVRAERRWERSGVSHNPFASVPAESLVRSGFVQTNARGTWYYAPDARVLLSEPFLEHHCLRAQPGGGKRRGLLGLLFEPVKKRRVPDVEGALWVDEKTSELRFIEFRYTGLALPFSTDALGGRVEFRRLPNGAWIVQRWFVRMPAMKEVDHRFRDAGVPGAPVERPSTVLTGIRESGGQVLSTSFVH